MRTPGEPTTPEERSAWPMDRLVKETKKLIRTDWGGLKASEGATKNLIELGVPEDIATAVGRHVAILCRKQVRGCRARCAHNFDEMARRISGA